MVARAHGDAVTCSSTGSKDKGGRSVLSSDPGAIGFLAFAVRWSSSSIHEAIAGISSWRRCMRHLRQCVRYLCMYICVDMYVCMCIGCMRKWFEYG